jgi:uncharacterized protein (DUF2336 family)
MKNLLRKIFSWRALPQELSYEESRAVLEKHNRKTRRELASRPDAAPEVLYYLSEDEMLDVRVAVAANPSTPIQASELLADDPEEQVRVELARRISRLVPGADETLQGDLLERVIALVEKLAEDRLPRVRAIVAEEIKATTNVPARIVKKLAYDAEISVSAPILEYSPLLSDADLMELIAESAVDGAAEAIASRAEVGEDLVETIARSMDVPAVTALLANPNAQIREDTLDLLISRAIDIDALHEPLAMRPNLSMRAIRRIASFVARSLLEDLLEREGLDVETQKHLRDRVMERVEGEDGSEKLDATLASVRSAFEAGKLDDPSVTKLADAGEKECLGMALSLLIGEPVKKISEVMDTRSPEAITAMCWKAGLSMRTALAVQKALHIKHPDLLLPKDGFEYPLDGEKLNLQLEFFGIAPKRQS